MASCATSVNIIATNGTAGRYGIVITAVTPITGEPPSVMLCINKEVGILPVLLANRDLCINILSYKQQDIAKHFAGMTNLSSEERFIDHIWNRGQNGQLEIEGALTHLHGSTI